MLDTPASDTAPQPDEAEQATPRGWSRRAVAGGAVAALVGLGGAGALLAWPRRAYAATAVGERRTVRLPDGSHATLNTDTRVSWRVRGAREFWIEQGEAALFVREAEAPFRIYSDAIDARLSGGRFDLRVAPNGGRLLVLAGRAAAAYRGTRAETVQAGSALAVDSRGAARVAVLSPDALAAATAWQNGRILFNGMPLDRALAEFNRYLPEKIVLQESALGSTRLGGEFLIEDPDSFLVALHDSFEIDHRREGNQILLFRKHP